MEVEEILMQLDCFHSRIGQCEAKCESADAENDRGYVLCVAIGIHGCLLKKRDLRATKNLMVSWRS